MELDEIQLTVLNISRETKTIVRLMSLEAIKNLDLYVAPDRS